MKSIAEYFRDLAADDRYFGAEPPTPDAEVLHRIAEQQVQKRVEARIEENGVVLRQESADLPSTREAASDMAVGKSLLRDDVQQADESSREAASDHYEKSQRIEAGDDIIKHAAVHLEENTAASDQTDRNPYTDDDPMFEKIGAMLPTNVDMYTEDDVVKPVEVGKPTNASEKIAIISAAVDDFEYIGEFAEDQDTAIVDSNDNNSPAGTNDMQALMEHTHGAGTRTSDAVAAQEAKEIHSNVDEDMSFEERLAEIERNRAASGNEKQHANIRDPRENADVEQTDDDVDAILEQLAQAEVDNDVHMDKFENPSKSNLQDTSIDILTEESRQVDQDDDPLRPVARITRIRRSAGRDNTMTMAAAQEDRPEAAKNRDTALQDESEPVSMIDDKDIDTSARRKQALDSSETREDDQTLKRILEETNDKMDSQEVTRRRSSIEHLKAAVQAKRADQDAGDDLDEQHEQDAYREDLARAVRPSNPNKRTTEIRPRRPKQRDTEQAAPSMAPLVLVSEQRVDQSDADDGQYNGETAQHVSPDRVSPRRIDRSSMKSTENSDIPAPVDQDPETQSDRGSDIENDRSSHYADPNDFASYLDDSGATDMTEMMEVAASFVSNVKGQPEFTRPKVMRLVTGLDVNGDISREEALRAFGRLLRSGRIVKVARGRYALADDENNNDGRQLA